MNPVISFLALGAGVLLWWALRRGAPSMPAGVRRVLGWSLVAAGIGLAVLRQFGPGLALGAMGIVLVAPGLFGSGARANPTPGGVSEVETAALRMVLDHDTGAMEGEVLRGPFAGRTLSELGPEELDALMEALAADEDSLRLLLAWLERNGRETGPQAVPEPGRMSEAEAYRVLGLEPGASLEEVRAAYRRLIRKVHPDLGGSAALSALLNAAKDRLDPS